MTRPEQRANPTQRRNVRLEMLAEINAICDHWPAIDRAAAAANHIWQARTDGGSAPGTHADPTASLVANLADGEPARWIGQLEHFRSTLRRMAAWAQDLDPPPARNVGRVNTAGDLCVKCGQPIDGKAIRIDGNPVCATSCYHQLYRQAKAEGVIVGVLIRQLGERLRANGSNSAGQTA